MKRTLLLASVLAIIIMNVALVFASEFVSPVIDDTQLDRNQTELILVELSAEGFVNIVQQSASPLTVNDTQVELAELSAQGFVNVVTDSGCSFALKEFSAQGYHIKCQ